MRGVGAVPAEMIRKGWVTPPARPLTDPPPRAPVTTLAELMRELDANREAP
jgi:hypothetical protein